MPDSALNQAAGLLGISQAQGPTLIPMVSHGDDKTELPVLWQLCSMLVEMGYPIHVLDGTQAESEENPGLRDLLDYRFGYAPPVADSPDWPVTASALGLQDLCNFSGHRPAPLQRIVPLFPAGSVVLLYAGADILIKLLAEKEVRPLLCVSSEKNSLLTSYLALKRLLLKGGVEPLILNMMAESQTRGAAHSGALGNNLGECARNFLGYEVKSLNIQAMADRSIKSADLRGLVSRLLDCAAVLNHPVSSPPQAITGFAAGPMSRSH